MVNSKDIMEELLENILADIENLDNAILGQLHRSEKISVGIQRLIQEL